MAIDQPQRVVSDASVVGAPEEFKVYKWRWVVLAAYSTLTISNAMMWVSYSAIADLTRDYYQVSVFVINLQSMVFMAMTVPFNFVASDILARWGCRKGVLLGALLTAAGAWIRWIPGRYAPWNAVIFTAGQTLGAIAQPFVINAPSQLSSLWFPDDQRILATSLGVVANSIGVAIGFGIPPFVTNQDMMKVRLVMLIEAIIFSVCFGVAFFFMSDKPKSPPSASAMNAERVKAEEGTSLKRDLISMLSKPSFRVLVGSFCVANGIFNVIATLLSQIMGPYGFTDNQTSIFAMSTIVAGLFGSIVFGILADKFKCHRQMLFISTVTASIGLFVLGLALQFKFSSNGLMIGGTIVFGFVFIPVLPISFDLAVEYTYPVNEATSQGFLIAIGQVAGVAGILGLQGLAKDGRGAICLYISAFLIALSMPTISLLSSRYSRLAIDEANQSPLFGPDGEPTKKTLNLQQDGEAVGGGSRTAGGYGSV